METQLQKLTETELKALAYDMLAQIQLSQRNLDAINGELASRAQAASQVPPPPPPTQSPPAEVIPRVGTAEAV